MNRKCLKDRVFARLDGKRTGPEQKEKGEEKVILWSRYFFSRLFQDICLVLSTLNFNVSIMSQQGLRLADLDNIIFEGQPKPKARRKGLSSFATSTKEFQTPTEFPPTQPEEVTS